MIGMDNQHFMRNFARHLSNWWANNRNAGDLRRHSAYHDVTVMHAVVSACVAVTVNWAVPVPGGWESVHNCFPWWRHEMEIFSALLALCAGNSPVTDELPSQRPVTRSFYSTFSLICTLNKRFSKQSWGWWFETPSRSLWRHCNAKLEWGHESYIPWEIVWPCCLEEIGYNLWDTFFLRENSRGTVYRDPVRSCQIGLSLWHRKD